MRKACLVTIVMLLILVVPSISNAQTLAQEEIHSVIKKANSAVLEFIVENGVTDPDKIENIEEVREYKKQLYLNEDAFKDYYLQHGNSVGIKGKPELLYEQIIVDGEVVDVLVYPDGSFALASIAVYEVDDNGLPKINDGEIKETSKNYTILSSGTRFFHQFYSGTGSKSATITLKIYAPYLVSNLTLNANFTVGNNISVTSRNTAGTYHVFPHVANGSPITWVSPNNTTPVSIWGEYYYKVYVGAIPVMSVTKLLEMRVFKSSTGYYVSGWHY